MALDVSKMSCTNHGSHAVWVYPVGEAIVGANYFDDMAHMLKVGDVIIHLETDELPSTYYVASITDGVVALSEAGA